MIDWLMADLTMTRLELYGYCIMCAVLERIVAAIRRKP